MTIYIICKNSLCGRLSFNITVLYFINVKAQKECKSTRGAQKLEHSFKSLNLNMSILFTEFQNTDILISFTLYNNYWWNM